MAFFEDFKKFATQGQRRESLRSVVIAVRLGKIRVGAGGRLLRAHAIVGGWCCRAAVACKSA